MINTIKQALENSFSYADYRKKVTSLIAEGKNQPNYLITFDDGQAQKVKVIGQNSTYLFYVPENGIFPNGSVDIIGQKTAGVIGLDTYFTTEFKKILPYARPN